MVGRWIGKSLNRMNSKIPVKIIKRVEVEQDQVHGHTSIFELLSLENIKAIYSRSSLVFLALPYLSI